MDRHVKWLRRRVIASVATQTAETFALVAVVAFAIMHWRTTEGALSSLLGAVVIAQLFAVARLGLAMRNNPLNYVFMRTYVERPFRYRVARFQGDEEAHEAALALPGFAPVATIRDAEADPEPCFDIYHDPSRLVAASVSRASGAVALISSLADGRILVTDARVMPPHERLVARLADDDSVETVIATHQRAVAERDDVVELASSAHQVVLDSLNLEYESFVALGPVLSPFFDLDPENRSFLRLSARIKPQELADLPVRLGPDRPLPNVRVTAPLPARVEPRPATPVVSAAVQTPEIAPAGVTAAPIVAPEVVDVAQPVIADVDAAAAAVIAPPPLAVDAEVATAPQPLVAEVTPDPVVVAVPQEEAAQTLTDAVVLSTPTTPAVQAVSPSLATEACDIFAAPQAAPAIPATPEPVAAEPVVAEPVAVPVVSEVPAPVAAEPVAVPVVSEIAPPAFVTLEPDHFSFVALAEPVTAEVPAIDLAALAAPIVEQLPPPPAAPTAPPVAITPTSATPAAPVAPATAPVPAPVAPATAPVSMPAPAPIVPEPALVPAAAATPPAAPVMPEPALVPAAAPLVAAAAPAPAPVPTPAQAMAPVPAPEPVQMHVPAAPATLAEAVVPAPDSPAALIDGDLAPTPHPTLPPPPMTPEPATNLASALGFSDVPERSRPRLSAVLANKPAAAPAPASKRSRRKSR